MRPRPLFLTIVLLLVLATACAAAANPLSTEVSNSVPIPATYAAPMAAPMDGIMAYDERGYQTVDDVTEQESQTTPGRVVLKNAVLTLVVDDVDAKVAQISALAGDFTGWVVNAQVTRMRVGDESRVSYGTITVRVDADRLDEALVLIKQGVNEVESEAITGQDVTQDYVDLSGQVANLETAEQQLQEIMSRATKTEDVLSVFNELVRVRGEIETIRGRLNYYDEASSTSSIQITLRPTPVIQPVEIGGWRPLETARDAFQALVNVLQDAADFAIGVVVFALPLVIVAIIPVLLLRRRRRMARAAG